MEQFIRGWRKYITETGEILYRPVLGLLIKETDGIIRGYDFFVDSGADISLAPRNLAQRVGLDWKTGKEVMLKGISKRKVCEVEGKVQEITVILPELNLKLDIPICFARGRVPFLLGREGFFDYFNITFDKVRKRCTFKLRKL